MEHGVTSTATWVIIGFMQNKQTNKTKNPWLFVVKFD